MYRTHSTVFVTQNNQFICKLLKVRAHITVLARNFYFATWLNTTSRLCKKTKTECVSQLGNVPGVMIKGVFFCRKKMKL